MAARESGLHVIAGVRTPAASQRAHGLGKGAIQRRALRRAECARGRSWINTGSKEHFVTEQIAHARYR